MKWVLIAWWLAAMPPPHDEQKDSPRVPTLMAFDSAEACHAAQKAIRAAKPAPISATCWNSDGMPD